MLPSVAVKGITVKYELGAAEFAEKLFGFRPADDDLASLAGALDGATVNVSVRVKKSWLYLAVDDPTRFEVYETSVRRDAADALFAYIHEVRVAAGQGGQGLGIRAFQRQVRGAKSLGIEYFKLWAAGDYFDQANNGYYTWARFGFDAPLTTQQRQLRTADLLGATNVNTVILQKRQDWWRRYGYDAEMYFDLAEGSAMMNVFRKYLADKGMLRE
jgi:hypothetical protein